LALIALGGSIWGERIERFVPLFSSASVANV